jgi:AbrB family looped-hinge helix DNA binding protein
MKTTVSEKGQITIPKKVREQLGLRPGSILEVSASGGRLLAVKKDRSDPFTKWRGRGALPGGLTIDEYLSRGRG